MTEVTPKEYAELLRQAFKEAHWTIEESPQYFFRVKTELEGRDVVIEIIDIYGAEVTCYFQIHAYSKTNATNSSLLVKALHTGALEEKTPESDDVWVTWVSEENDAMVASGLYDPEDMEENLGRGMFSVTSFIKEQPVKLGRTPADTMKEIEEAGYKYGEYPQEVADQLAEILKRG